MLSFRFGLLDGLAGERFRILLKSLLFFLFPAAVADRDVHGWHHVNSAHLRAHPIHLQINRERAAAVTRLSRERGPFLIAASCALWIEHQERSAVLLSVFVLNCCLPPSFALFSFPEESSWAASSCFGSGNGRSGEKCSPSCRCLLRRSLLASLLAALLVRCLLFAHCVRLALKCGCDSHSLTLLCVAAAIWWTRSSEFPCRPC